MSEELTKQLFSFIKSSPTGYHAVETMRKELADRGYEQLLESRRWELRAGGKYYVIRNGSALIAFRIPQEEFSGFQIMASHSDSPAFKIKENPEMEADGHYVKLNVEKYGGMLCAPWFDRPLSVAGRLMVREENRIVSKLVNVDRDFVMIPNLAIHMNREANEGVKYHAQKDMLPLYGDESAKGGFMRQIAEAADVNAKDIAGSDLFLYNRMPGSIWGADRQYMSVGRLDDLQCVFASFKGFLAAQDGGSVPVHCVLDNEEVGSGTRQGAASTFLYDTLANICEYMGKSQREYRRLIAASMMLSADNGHAVHPNYAEKACPTNRPYLNGGVLLKYSANQKYTTDGLAAAMFKEVCRRAGVPYQIYLNHSDVLGGSTLGNISGTQVAVNTADIGAAILAMHSPYETGGVKDTEYLTRMAETFFSASVEEEDYGVYTLK